MSNVDIPKINYPSTKEYHGLYRGKIVSNLDPEKLCRLKVRVHGFYDEIDEAHIPWALPSLPFGGGSNFGLVNIPTIGSDVWIMFSYGDILYPVWMGAFYGIPSTLETPKPVIADNSGNISKDPEVNEPSNWKPEYPHNSLWQTPNGIAIELDDTPSNRRVHIWHPSGTHIELRENGDMVEHIKGNHKIIIDGNQEEIIKGNHTVTLTGNRTETMQSNHTVDLTGNRNNTIHGNQTNLVLGNFTEQIGGTYSFTVVGAATELFASTLDHTVTLKESVYDLAGYSQEVTGDSTSTSIGNSTFNITGSTTRSATVSIVDSSPVITHN